MLLHADSRDNYNNFRAFTAPEVKCRHMNDFIARTPFLTRCFQLCFRPSDTCRAVTLTLQSLAAFWLLAKSASSARFSTFLLNVLVRSQELLLFGYFLSTQQRDGVTLTSTQMLAVLQSTKLLDSSSSSDLF